MKKINLSPKQLSRAFHKMGKPGDVPKFEPKRISEMNEAELKEYARRINTDLRTYDAHLHIDKGHLPSS